MQIGLELLAPARNAQIGIAAIDCGADAVYIAGPAFGARAAAGNEVTDIARLCRYAHLYGVKIHATVNTLLQGDELADAHRLMWDLYEAGVDVFIIQDLGLLSLDLPPVELHASTQTAIRTPERARELAALGFSRLVLERQLTLEQIRAIRAAVPESCGLEFFIHGALCVGYSGQCYLSQYLTGRSANRGACAQACRSRYDLTDAEGHVLVRDQTLLSPKDIRFDGRVADLVAAGITSFKIEGRLKNASYVKNVVRHYRKVLDAFISAGPLYGRASAGRLEGGFTPDPDKTFGRGWTEALLDGRKEK
ncbi:MAG: U32 family peptidase, partial [Bacteroidales bacterium]|nr:U32 family peptidase [Bacteroidales bacterium]